MYGLVKAFARCLSDKRAPEKIRHTLADLIGQRIFGIACGHPDCNDAEHLADDPIHKLLLGRDPVAGESLASQPTLSRFENAAGRGALYDMGCELAARVVERHRRRLGRVRRITIDLDPTDDPTHGAQQYSLFLDPESGSGGGPGHAVSSSRSLRGGSFRPILRYMGSVTRRDWWMGLGLLAVALILHAAIPAFFPRYEFMIFGPRNLDVLKVDRWTGENEALSPASRP